MGFYDSDNPLSSFISRHSWVSEFAGILPLSALIDFIEIPPKLHILQLTGDVPLWSWVITPAGSRLLLAEQGTFASQNCLQDRFGETTALETLDGRYGERYYASSPETLRLMIEGLTAKKVHNDHNNMTGKNLRLQNLEIVHLTRRRDPSIVSDTKPLASVKKRRTIIDKCRAYSLYMVVSSIGWVLLLGLIVMSAAFKTWISFSFLISSPVTGLVVTFLYGLQPRRLLVDSESDFNRLLLVTEHMNSTDWLVVYGESTIVNSMLNRPLEPGRRSVSRPMNVFLRAVLRVFILGQWGLALGASATKDLDSYIIVFWISFSIFSHAYLLTPSRGAKFWSQQYANLNIDRCSTQLSSRRALLNTIMALNPDTFPPASKDSSSPETTTLYREGLKWMDPILTPSGSRSKWEEATREAMIEAGEHVGSGDLCSKKYPYLNDDWRRTYLDGRSYWAKFIPEGIYMAEKIRNAIGLPKIKVVRKCQE